MICGTTVEQFEWFLKGPYSWRKPDFGEKSYLWLAFFNLWNRRTKISSVEYLWFYLFFVCFLSLERLSFFYYYYYSYSICASFRRSISNLFVCWLLSKLFPVIIISSVWFDPPHLLMVQVAPCDNNDKWDRKVFIKYE